jgi:enoyl-[acyl-carrier protein] reductase II
MFGSRITSLFGISVPIIQAGMVWCSGWKLASAVSNAGGLGVIGAGSMYPETLREHIRKCNSATRNPFAVNIPLLYPDIDKHIKTVIEGKVPIVFTSAGNPATWTSELKSRGIKVVHVVSSVKFARKAADAGVDAVVAEGFEAGGHNGREETTTFVLLPMVRDAIDVPLIAAGGIKDGRTMVAAEALGAEAVQIGSRFAISEESSAHPTFKERVIRCGEGETVLTLKKLTPVRLIRNAFYDQVHDAEAKGATVQQLQVLLGTRRAKRGIFEGDLDEGELEIGQVSASLNKIQPAAEIVREIWQEYREIKTRICDELH